MGSWVALLRSIRSRDGSPTLVSHPTGHWPCAGPGLQWRTENSFKGTGSLFFLRASSIPFPFSMVFKGNPSISGQRLALELGLSGGGPKRGTPMSRTVSLAGNDLHHDGRPRPSLQRQGRLRRRPGAIGPAWLWGLEQLRGKLSCPFHSASCPDFFDLSQDRVWSTSAFATFKPHVLSKQAAGEGG